MKKGSFPVAVLVLASILLNAGCAATMNRSARPVALKEMSGVTKQQGNTEFKADRMLIWRAHLQLEVGDVTDALGKATAIAEQNGGYVEWKSENAEESAGIRFRIPVNNFKSAIGAMEGLGTVNSRSVNGEDVTEKYIDAEARLKNKIVLRDRLKQLLEKATEVKDILAIETELNRVQADIDSMEGIIKSLKGQVDFATVELSLERKQILGPLGYVFKGLWWGVKKLFVLRD